MYAQRPYDHRTIDHGGSRWADEREVRDSLSGISLDQPHPGVCGLPLISDGRNVCVDNKDSHAAIFGSTGAKKSRLLVMPTLKMIAQAGESVVVTDPKSELYERSAGMFREAGYDVLVLNLRDPHRSNGYSLLHAAVAASANGDTERGVAMMDDLGATLFPHNNKIDPFWEETSRSLWNGLSGLIVEKPELFGNYSLQTILDLLNALDPDDTTEGTMALMDLYPRDSVAVNMLRASIQGSEKTWSNVKVSFLSGVRVLYSRKSLVNMLSTPDIDFSQLGRRKTALFLLLPDESTSLYGIASLLIKQLYEALIRLAQSQQDLRLPVRVNMLLDEFCNLPTIPSFATMMSAARSRNIRFFLVVQGLHQLEAKYQEDAETIRGNCNTWVYLFSREMELLRMISDLCGTDMRTGRPLITTTQLQMLDKNRGQALILFDRAYPHMTYLPDIDQYAFPAIVSPDLPVMQMHTFSPCDPNEICRREFMRQREIARSRRAVSQVSAKAENQNADTHTDDDLETYLYQRFDELFGRKSS